MVLLLVCTSLASSQMTNIEISNMISRSKEANLKSGVFNPNLVFPGQNLTFLFTNGIEKSILVVKGDNQWTIVRDKISKMEKQNGPVVNYPELVPPVRVTVVQPSEPELTPFPWWSLIGLIFLALFIYFVYRLFSDRYRNIDPVNAGEPQVEGGITDSIAHNRMSELAAQQFPGATLIIKNIRRGLLSGPADIFYAGSEKPKKINLKDVHAYAGEISVNGHIQTIYFLQGCGNDARMGNLMSGEGLTFIPDVIINEDGSVTQILTPAPVVIESTEEVKKEPVVTEKVAQENSGSETHQQRMMVLSIIQAEVSKGDVHEFTVDSSKENFGVTVKYKFAPNSKKSEKDKDSDK